MGMNKEQWQGYKKGKQFVNLIALFLCAIGCALIAGQLVNYAAYTSLADEVQVLSKETMIGYKAWDWMTLIACITVLVIPLLVVVIDIFFVDKKERDARDAGNNARMNKDNNKFGWEERCKENIWTAKGSYIFFIVAISVSFVYAAVILVHCMVMLIAPPDDPPADALVFYKLILSGLIIAALGHILMIGLYGFNLANVDKVCNADTTTSEKKRGLFSTIKSGFDPTKGSDAAARYFGNGVKFA